MIRALITDIDGVLVGSLTGFNFPNPDNGVIKTLQMLHTSGIPVVLCTGRFHLSILEIIQAANLGNPHITDGGALIIDPLNKGIIKEVFIDNSTAKELLDHLKSNGLYVEVYTNNNYFIEDEQDSQITNKRTAILQREPEVVTSFSEEISSKRIIKIMVPDKDKEKIMDTMSLFQDKVTTILTEHPSIADFHIGIITAPNVSKRQAMLEVVQSLNIPLQDILGIGDTLGDWNFMELCGYVGVVGNDSDLAVLAKSKERNHYYIGKPVNQKGFMEIIDFFFG